MLLYVIELLLLIFGLTSDDMLFSLDGASLEDKFPNEDGTSSWKEDVTRDVCPWLNEKELFLEVLELLNAGEAGGDSDSAWDTLITFLSRLGLSNPLPLPPSRASLEEHLETFLDVGTEGFCLKISKWEVESTRCLKSTNGSSAILIYSFYKDPNSKKIDCIQYAIETLFCFHCIWKVGYILLSESEEG